MSFSKKIIDWYVANKRDLPWRNTSNPYFIWISEVILQQTRVNQGMSYYKDFINIYPNISLLAKASEDKILKVWEGLGYYSRARNMHTAAKQIIKEYEGKFPTSYDSLIKLKGIGEYTAAAIASIAYSKPHAVVDGNVYRVLSRVYNIATPINTSKGKKEFYALANEILDKKNPGIHNQAIMELGAIICTPQKPSCNNCCIQEHCYAYMAGKQDELPVKLKKAGVKKRYFFYFFMHSKNKFIIQKRTNKDIWQGLYELPLIETEEALEIEEVILQWKKKMRVNKHVFTIKNISPLYTHKLTHQTIYAHFINIEMKELSKLCTENSTIAITNKNIQHYAFPILIINYLNSCNFRDI